MIYELDSVTGYRLKRNFAGEHSSREYKALIYTNSEGLRDAEHPVSKSKDTFRILILGDSITFGYGVKAEESYPKVLERLLNSEGTGRYEVINAGIPGYGTAQEYLYLRESGLKYEPDLVIVGFFGNDFENNLYDGLFSVREGKLVPGGRAKGASLKNPILINILSNTAYIYISQHSHLLNFIKLRIGAFIERYVNKGRSEKFHKTLYSVKESEDTKASLEITKLLFLEIDKLVKDNGVRVLFLMIPSPEQLAPRRFGFEGDGYDVTLPLFKLSGFSMKNSLDMIDLAPFLKDIGGVFYVKEAHLTESGHQLIGEVLFNKIKRTGQVH